MKRLILPLILLVLISLLAGLGWRVAQRSRSAQPLATPSLIPTAASVTTPSTTAPPSASSPAATVSQSPTATPSANPLSSVLLPVPFTVQAPDADWSEPWKEGCEEAALLMVDAYLKGNHADRLPADVMKTEIARMVDWQQNRFGSHRDLGVAEMAIIAKEYLGRTPEINAAASLEDIKNELRAGNPVIVPAAGQLLENPYFKQPGPPYHVFVLTGFTGKEMIANENGTRRGYQYHYPEAILKAALHDHKEGTVLTDNPMAYLVLKQ